MKKKIDIRKRIEGVMMMCLLFIFLLMGCGNNEMMDGRTLSFSKDGTFTKTIREELSADYYDFDELKQMNKNEIEEYNRLAGDEAVSVLKEESDGKLITLSMRYRNADDYYAMTRLPLFIGTVAQAKASGYDLNVSLTGIKDGTTINKEDLSSMEERHIVIVSEPVNVETFGTILYVSEGVTVDKKGKMATVSGEKMSYIVFK